MTKARPPLQLGGRAALCTQEALTPHNRQLDHVQLVVIVTSTAVIVVVLVLAPVGIPAQSVHAVHCLVVAGILGTRRVVVDGKPDQLVALHVLGEPPVGTEGSAVELHADYAAPRHARERVTEPSSSTSPHIHGS